MSIHSRNDDVILQFGLKKPAFRIVVNSPTTHGSIGLSTGLDPAMTLGCGGYGGNITSDNISPRHLLNIKRVAYEVTPVAHLEPARNPRPPPRPRRAPTGCRRRRRRLRNRAASPRRLSPGGSISSWSPAASAGARHRRWPRRRHRPRHHPPRPRPSRRHLPDRRNRCRSRSISCAKTTSGRQCGRAANWSSANGPSSRQRRAISASSTGCSCRPNGRVERLLPLPVDGVGVTV